ncbi:MAG: hypothetical protein IPJ02_17775 [Chitinophagaceae bacterium]|nr:hypothetical protein [Chitinophagaceae bacterium]
MIRFLFNTRVGYFLFLVLLGGFLTGGVLVLFNGGSIWGAVIGSSLAAIYVLYSRRNKIKDWV